MFRQNRKNRAIVVVAILSLMTIGCAAFTKYGQMEKQARQLYAKGNFKDAFYTCVTALKMKPGYDKAQILIQQAYPDLVNQHETKIKTLENASDEFRWDAVVDEYDQLIAVNTTLTSLPQLVDKKTQQVIQFNVRDYSPFLRNAKMNAAKSHYAAGDRISKIQSLDSQKQAAKEFKAADHYVSGFQDAGQRYEVCRKAGIKRMAIIPFDNKSGKAQYGAVEEMITDRVISLIMNDREAMEFLEIVSRDQLLQVMQEQKLGMTGTIDDATAVTVGKILGVHELLTGKITQIRYTPERTTNRSYVETERVPVGTEKYVDDKGKMRERTVWGDVQATVTAYTKTAQASLSGSYQIVDVATARVKKSESFEGVGDYLCEWAKFRGDERALTNNSKRLARQAEGFAPTDDELVNDASDDLSNKLAGALKRYAM
ncbi:hypothetical protein JW960_26000 [candidate division KSB1 bacterium]|nr:hypothetical protein [candidate division KSB1 bacterium]